jgi:sporulation protein YlmC with PRC-barrel domain
MNDNQPGVSEIVSTADVEGVAVYDAAGRRLGKIDHLLIDKVSGQVHSVVIVVKGFVGLGHSHAELRWDSLRYNDTLRAYVAAADTVRKASSNGAGAVRASPPRQES